MAFLPQTHPSEHRTQSITISAPLGYTHRTITGALVCQSAMIAIMSTKYLRTSR
jgi:hypothetical protein